MEPPRGEGRMVSLGLYAGFHANGANYTSVLRVCQVGSTVGTTVPSPVNF